MYIHTLSHDVAIYCRVLIVVTCYSASALAAHISSRLRHQSGSSFILLYGSMLLAVIAFQWIVSGPRAVLGSAHSWQLLLLSLPVCGWLGYLTYAAEKKLVHALYKARSAALPVASPFDAAPRARSKKLAYGKAGFTRIQDTGMSMLLLLAILEELVYRGVLMGIIWQIPHGGIIRGIALAAIVVAFAASHIVFGLENMISKIVLSSMTTASAIVLGNVMGAIVIHLAFNYRLWRNTHRVADGANEILMP